MGAKIRFTRPDFYRDEILQDLENKHPGQYIMLTLNALPTQCDAVGRFEYKPRTLHLDILPFIQFDFESTLQLLVDSGHIQTYEVAGKKYGFIPSFTEPGGLLYQVIRGKEAEEAKSGGRYPAPPSHGETIGKPSGNHRGFLEGNRKGKEIEGEEEDSTTQNLNEDFDSKKSKAANNSSRDHLFSESKFFDFKKFEAAFSGTEYELCDLEYYHQRIQNWANSKAVKKKDWIATARNFMLGDKAEGKLKLKSKSSGTHLRRDIDFTTNTIRKEVAV